MKNLPARIVSLILCAFLTAGLLPGLAFADTSDLYICRDSGVFTPYENITYEYLNETRDVSEEYTNIKDAGKYIREQMVKRNSDIVLAVNIDMDPHMLITALMDEAFAHTGVPTEGDYLLGQYKGWRCRISYTDTGMIMSCNIDYFTTAEQEAEMNDAVNSLLSRLDVYDKSDYVKVKTIYDWICQNVKYDYDQNSGILAHSAYAALINRKAVCQGYAILLYRLLLEVGVDCRYIISIPSENHAWNIVKVDGLYYNVDVTWDAGNDKYLYFLKSMYTFDEHTRDTEYNEYEYVTKYIMSFTDYENPEFLSEIMGDINGDFVFDSYDAVIYLRYLANWGYRINESVADLNGDNNNDSSDIILILRHLAGWSI